MDNKSQGERVPEDMNRLYVTESAGHPRDCSVLADQLKDDAAVLVRDTSPVEADEIVRSIANAFGMGDGLEIQAGFGATLGHRRRQGKYFMTVNRRRPYQFIPPHSEGTSVMAMQLAAFFCFENSTDGGETVLFNVRPKDQPWRVLKELVVRGEVTTTMTRSAVARAKMLYGLKLPEGLLTERDEVIRERETIIEGLRIFDALTLPRKTYSGILERPIHTYWDSIGNIDVTSAGEYAMLLNGRGMLKIPVEGLDIGRLDNAYPRRIWQSGVLYHELFQCTVSRKLAAGDLLICNNLSWAHSVANWTPDSGRRNVVAAFA